MRDSRVLPVSVLKGTGVRGVVEWESRPSVMR
jgi:hypothetical protein